MIYHEYINICILSQTVTSSAVGKMTRCELERKSDHTELGGMRSVLCFNNTVQKGQ